MPAQKVKVFAGFYRCREQQFLSLIFKRTVMTTKILL